MPAKPQKSVKEKAVASALALAAAEGWNNVTLAAVAKKARISLTALHEHIEDRHDLLAALERIIDRKTLERLPATPDPDTPPRDRLFEALMERFDVLNEDRAGLCAILDSFKTDPKQAVIGLPRLGQSMSWMLEACGLPTGGLPGAARVAGLAAVYLKTLWTWRTDDTADLSKTMAALDKSLGMAEQWAQTFGIGGHDDDRDRPET